MDLKNINWNLLLTAVIAISAIVSISQTAYLLTHQTTPKADLFASIFGRSLNPILLCEERPYGDITVGPFNFTKYSTLHVRYANIGYVPIHVYSMHLQSECFLGYKDIDILESQSMVIGVGASLEGKYDITKDFENDALCHYNVSILSNIGEDICSFGITKDRIL